MPSRRTECEAWKASIDGRQRQTTVAREGITMMELLACKLEPSSSTIHPTLQCSPFPSSSWRILSVGL